MWIEKEVKKRGARIISAAGEGTESDDPGQILMRRMVDAFAEYERAIIKRRTSVKADQEKNGIKRLYRVNELWKLGSLMENVVTPDEVKAAIRTAFTSAEQKATA